MPVNFITNIGNTPRQRGHFVKSSSHCTKKAIWHPAALRAELNMMYMPYGQGDLETAERRAHEIREKTKTRGEKE